MKTSIHVYERIYRELESRGDNRSGTINRDLERLYTMYARAIKEVPLSLPEAQAIVDCCNGTIYDARSAPLLWASIEDANNLDGLDDKWGIDGPALVEKLKGLSQLQALALIDAAERFWNLPDIGKDLDSDVRKFFNVI